MGHEMQNGAEVIGKTQGAQGSHKDWMSQGSLPGGGILGGNPCPIQFPDFSWLEERGEREGEVSRDLKKGQR